MLNTLLKCCASCVGSLAGSRYACFESKLFPSLSEDTYLLLAEDKGRHCQWFSVCVFDDILSADLTGVEIPVDLDSVKSGRIRLRRYLIPLRARQLYESLAEEQGVFRLGDQADVGIGYVTGANDYFHLTTEEQQLWKIPSTYCRPAVLSLGGHQGNVIRRSDWTRLERAGSKAFLLSLPAVREERLAVGVREYISNGRGLGIHKRYKCRVREPWFSVPHVRKADALLSYMAGGSPKLVMNPRGFVATNTLHLVRFLDRKMGKSIVAGWNSSLTRLSCELEGHALGGGLLKLEPSEAERVLVAMPEVSDANRVLKEVDDLLRQSRDMEAREIVDRFVLRKKYGLTAAECHVLQDAGATLERWRLHR